MPAEENDVDQSGLVLTPSGQILRWVDHWVLKPQGLSHHCSVSRNIKNNTQLFNNGIAERVNTCASLYQPLQLANIHSMQWILGREGGFRLQRLLDKPPPIISGIKLHDIKVVCTTLATSLMQCPHPHCLCLRINKLNIAPILLQANVHTYLRQPVSVCLSLPKTNSLTSKIQ